ncbi:MAG: 5'-3' exonuclease H3TH domain-containing protein [bacterium]
MRLLLVDGHYYAYRSFYAIRHLTNSKGEPTNAVYGFIKALKRMLQDLAPDRAAVIFDSGPPARLAMQKDYKAQRPETPPDLEAQLPVIQRVVAALGFKQIAIHGEEADDIIASYALAASAQGCETVLATSDKDLLQIVNPHCLVYQTNKDGFQLLGSADVGKKWGVPPEKIGQALALIGDTSDNIPGVPGIGPKTAAELIRQFGDAEMLLRRLNEVASEKQRAVLEQHAERIRLNLEMFKLRDQLPLPEPLEELRITPDTAAQIREFEALEFKTFLREIQKSDSRQGELF